jgi:hypothetical protein
MLVADPTDGLGGEPASVGAIFEAAAAQGIATRLLVEQLPADAAYDPDEAKLLRQALDAGQLVIIPERPVDLGGVQRLGWWLVDPVSGATVDQMDDGGGQVVIQYVIWPSIIILALYALWAYGDKILCAFGIDRAAMSGDVQEGLGLSPGNVTSSCGGASTTTPGTNGPTMRPMKNNVQPAHPYSSGAPDPARAVKEKKRRAPK